MSEFKSRFIHGVFWNALLAIGRQGLNFLATIILARLLLPEDYGLMGMMAVIISVSESLIDAGLGGALIKKRMVQPVDYSTLSLYNLCVSLFLYLIIFFTAPYISNFYNTPLLSSLLRLYSLIIIIESFSIVPKTILIRNLQFKKYSLITLISGAIGLITAIIMALNNYGVFSLIWQYIVSSASLSFLLYIMTKYKLKFSFSKKSFREMFGFGINTTMANILKGGTENIFINVVAKISPLATTGYFNQSYKLQSVITSISNTIVDGALFPILSKENDELIINHSLRITSISYTLMSTFVFLLILNADVVVYIVLGHKWAETIPYLRILLCWGLIQMGTSLNRNLLKSLAYTLSILKTEIYSSVICFIMIIMVTMGLGVDYLLFSLVTYALIRFLISLIELKRKCKLSIINNLKMYAQAFFPSFLPCFLFLKLRELNVVGSIIVANLFFILLVIISNRIWNKETYCRLKNYTLLFFKK